MHRRYCRRLASFGGEGMWAGGPPALPVLDAGARESGPAVRFLVKERILPENSGVILPPTQAHRFKVESMNALMMWQRRVLVCLAALMACSWLSFGQETLDPRPDLTAVSVSGAQVLPLETPKLFTDVIGFDFVEIVVDVRNLTDAWPDEAPLSLVITDASGNVVWSYEEPVPLAGQHVLHTNLGVGEYVLTAMVDPHNVINELHEENNTAESTFSVVYQPDRDLYVVPESTSVTRVEAVAVANNRAVSEILEMTARSVLGPNSGVDDVQVSATSGSDGSLVIELTAWARDTATEEYEGLVEALEALWFVDAAVVRAPDVEALTPVRFFEPMALVSIDVTLSQVDLAMDYWRVEAAVGHDWLMFLLIADYWPSPISVRFANSATGAEETIFVRPWVGDQTPAVAFFPVAESTTIEGVMTVDAREAVEEYDEDNNQARFAYEVEPVRDDLSFAANRIRSHQVTITSAIENEAMHAHLDALTVSAVGAHEAFQFVDVYPANDAHGASTTATLMVDIHSQNFGTPLSDVSAAIRAISEQWYVSAVEQLPSILAVSRVSPPIFELQVTSLAVTLNPSERAETLWRVAVPVFYDYYGPIPFAPTPGTPIAVAFQSTAATTYAVSYVRLPYGGEDISTAFLADDPNGLTVTVTLDPENVIAEADETNNAITFSVESETPGEDLSVVCDKAHVQAVDITASLDNPFLQQLVRQMGLQVLGELGEPLHLMVFPWHDGIAALDQFLHPSIVHEREFDLVVVVPEISYIAREASPVAEGLVAAYNAAWYAASAVQLDGYGRWDDLSTVIMPYGNPVTIGLTLVDSDAAVVYQEVHVPVLWEEDPNATGLFGLDLIWPGPELQDVAVEFTADTANGESARDYLSWYGHHRAMALVRAETGATIRVTADPDGKVEEVDEANNGCEVIAVEPPEPQAVFEVSARIVEDANTGTASYLLVNGSLTNPGSASLTLGFASSLQMDFVVNERHRWSADKAFTLALTEVKISPGETYQWTQRAALSDLPEMPLPWHVRAELVGTDFAADTVVGDLGPFPLPGPRPFGPETLDDIIDLIVGPRGVLLNFLPAGFSIMNRGDGGTIVDEGDGPPRYEPEDTFGGEDFFLFSDGNGTTGMRRLRVGPQTFSLELAKGWNLISFPTQPFEPVDALLARIPDGAAWAWRSGEYAAAHEIRVGEGVWLHTGEPLTLEYLGEPADAPAVELVQGWNLLGPVNTDRLPADPRISVVQSYENGNFDLPTELKQGKGYWVFATEALRLELN